MASSSPAEVHVLLVDDDRVTRMVVSGLLRKCNYQGARPADPRSRVVSQVAYVCVQPPLPRQ